MAKAGGYILRVDAQRWEVLEKAATGVEWYGPSRASEPVRHFTHSRNSPLIVFCCIESDVITHIADGKSGGSAGTRMTRLVLTNIQPLARPVQLSDLTDAIEPRFRRHLSRVFTSGGLLPAKTFGSVIDVILRREEQLASRLNRYSDERKKHIAELSPEAKTNLALQKETLAAALQISGVNTDELLTWTPATGGTQALFLEGLSQVRVREDAMIISDLSSLPGFDAFKDFQFAAKTFVNQTNPSNKVTVIMANKLPLEKQTGADLIYYNEEYRSFVFVQYKAMESENGSSVFRWKDGDQLADEISRMDKILEELAKAPKDGSPPSFRLHENPFFIKLCRRINFNPDDKGLFPGIYLPLEYWKCLALDPVTLGPAGGRRIGYEQLARRLSNTEFVSIVAGAWIGTTVPQSAALSSVIQTVLQTGKTVTFAVKRSPPDDAAGDTEVDEEVKPPVVKIIEA